MQQKDIPSVTLPTSDYDRMVRMSNHSLVSILREHVLSVHRVQRFSPRPPEDHDAYAVNRCPDHIIVHLWREGREIFQCVFVPPVEY